MPDLFTITTATNAVRLDDKRQAEIPFAVFNSSGQPIRGRARPVPQNPVVEKWLAVVGDAERDFPIGGTQQYSVKVTVPSDAPPGMQTFRLDMVGVALPDEQLAQGPSVTFEVPAAPVKKPFPIWIPIAGLIALVVVMAGIIIFLLLRNNNGGDGTDGTGSQSTTQLFALQDGDPSSRQVININLRQPGEIVAQATWTGTQANLALIINGPGQVGFFARQDGPSPLVVRHTVTQAEFQAGATWRVTVVSFGGGTANGQVNITFP